MDFSFPDKIEDLRRRLRDFLYEHWPVVRRAYAMNDAIARDLAALEPNAANVTPEEVRSFYRALGKAGFLAIGMPERYGGTGTNHLARYVLQTELTAVGAPYPNIALTMVAPTLISAGSDEFLDEHIPRIIAGEVEYCLGYTEPSAGTDLASLRTRAVRDGNGFRLNGQKIFSSSAHYADYYFVAARTDPDAPKHRGISVFLIPMDSPGITIHPLITNSGVRTNIVFIDDVWAPASALLGEENKGWSYLGEALAFERYAAMLSTPLVRAYEELVQAAGPSPAPEIAARLSALRADVRAADLLNLNAAWCAHDGHAPVVEAAESKLSITEVRHRLARFALELLGSRGLLDEFDPAHLAHGQFDLMYRHSVIHMFTAGANDIQRDMIAQVGQGMPRSAKPKGAGR